MSGPLFAAKSGPRLSAQRASGARGNLSPTCPTTACSSTNWRRGQLTVSFPSARRVFPSTLRLHLAASAAPGPIARSGSRSPAASPSARSLAACGSSQQFPLAIPHLPVATFGSSPQPPPKIALPGRVPCPSMGAQVPKWRAQLEWSDWGQLPRSRSLAGRCVNCKGKGGWDDGAADGVAVKEHSQTQRTARPQQLLVGPPSNSVLTLTTRSSVCDYTSKCGVNLA